LAGIQSANFNFAALIGETLIVEREPVRTNSPADIVPDRTRNRPPSNNSPAWVGGSASRETLRNCRSGAAAMAEYADVCDRKMLGRNITMLVSDVPSLHWLRQLEIGIRPIPSIRACPGKWQPASSVERV
jgi:hypothetical protein